jgi:hypothetical protein
LDQGEDTGFCRRVMCLLRATDEGADGGDADYAAALGSLLGEEGSGGLDGVECAG